MSAIFALLRELLLASYAIGVRGALWLSGLRARRSAPRPGSAGPEASLARLSASGVSWRRKDPA